MASPPSVSKPGLRKSKPKDQRIQKILSTFPEGKEFLFYNSLEEFTGQKATSLADFVNKLERIDLRSINFHQARKDFETWIRDVAGDPELALKLDRIDKCLQGEALRVEILRQLRLRLKEFQVTLP
jgi:hypothetical protein